MVGTSYDKQKAEQLLRRRPSPEARRELVEMTMPVVWHLARRYQGRGLEIEDLVQAGSIGLLNSIDRFDFSKGSSFLGFAVPTILGEMKRHFRDQGWVVRTPRSLQEMGTEVRAADDKLSQSLGRRATLAEIADHLGLHEDDVAEVAALGSAYTPDQIDLPGIDGMAVSDRLGEDDPGYGSVDYAVSLRPLIAEQPERIRRLLHLRFVEEMTQQEIADHLGVSQMQVSRLLRRALAKLRESLPE